MNQGVVRKAALELTPPTLIIGGALFLVDAVNAWVIPVLGEQTLAIRLQVKLLQKIVGAMLGTEITGTPGPELFLSIVWVHPVVLTLVWAHALLAGTRMPAGEIDRGTVDFLLGLPVSRWSLAVSEAVAWLGSAAVVLLLAFLGNLTGSAGAPPGMRPAIPRLWLIVLNLFCLYLAVGGFSFWISSLSDRRGRAMGTVLAVLLASYLLNFLTQFWEPAKRLAFLSVLSYYRPFFILRDGAWPTGNLAVLAGLGVGFWLLGAIQLSRRDLTTV